jgi:GDP-D-mannose 3', 5'-epimerase
MRKILVLGAGGFIGTHLVDELRKNPENIITAHSKKQFNLLDAKQCKFIFHEKFDIIYQLAADSGNKSYIDSKGFSYGNSTRMNLNILETLSPDNVGKFIYLSSFYARYPEDTYGLEKKYNETLYLKSMLPVSIWRLYPVFGICESNDKQEKFTNAICRKIAYASEGDTIDIPIDNYIRSFIYIDDLVVRLSDYTFGMPDYSLTTLIGSRFVSLEDWANKILSISEKKVNLNFIKTAAAYEYKQFSFTDNDDVQRVDFKNTDDRLRILYKYYEERCENESKGNI